VVRYYLELALAARQVEGVLLDAAAGWLSMVAGQAQRRGDQLLAEVGVGVGPLGPRLGRRVTIRVGQPVRVAAMTWLPLTWEPVGLVGVLPRLEADLEPLVVRVAGDLEVEHPVNGPHLEIERP
jgi:hypothetical protein